MFGAGIMFGRKRVASDHPIADVLERTSKVLGTYHSVSNESAFSYGLLASAELVEELAKRVVELEKNQGKVNLPDIASYDSKYLHG